MSILYNLVLPEKGWLGSVAFPDSTLSRDLAETGSHVAE